MTLHHLKQGTERARISQGDLKVLRRSYIRLATPEELLQRSKADTLNLAILVAL